MCHRCTRYKLIAAQVIAGLTHSQIPLAAFETIDHLAAHTATEERLERFLLVTDADTKAMEEQYHAAMER